MLENIKIIFINIDTIALDCNEKFSDYTKNIFKQIINKDISIVLCSNKANSLMIEKSKELGASPIVISSNGSIIFNYNESMSIYNSPINQKALDDIWSFCTSNDVNITLNGTYNCFKSFNTSSLSEINEEIMQIVVDTNQFEKITYLKNIVNTYNELESKNFDSFENGYKLDIVNKSNSTGSAVRKTLNYLNLNETNALCFGNTSNDLEMFEECGITVAMENSTNDLKQHANYITSSNDNDGVAEFIEEYLL